MVTRIYNGDGAMQHSLALSEYRAALYYCSSVGARGIGALGVVRSRKTKVVRSVDCRSQYSRKIKND